MALLMIPTLSSGQVNARKTLNLLSRRRLSAKGEQPSPWQQLRKVSNPAVRPRYRPSIHVIDIKPRSLGVRWLHAIRRTCCHGGCYRQPANILRDSIHDQWTSNLAAKARFRPSVYHMANKICSLTARWLQYFERSVTEDVVRETQTTSSVTAIAASRQASLR